MPGRWAARWTWTRGEAHGRDADWRDCGLDDDNDGAYLLVSITSMPSMWVPLLLQHRESEETDAFWCYLSSEFVL